MVDKWLIRAQPYIVEYLGHKVMECEATVFLCTDLMDGSLESLVSDARSPELSAIANRSFHHILDALAYLESKELVHRDVKPANVRL